MQTFKLCNQALRSSIPPVVPAIAFIPASRQTPNRTTQLAASFAVGPAEPLAPAFPLATVGCVCYRTLCGCCPPGLLHSPWYSLECSINIATVRAYFKYRCTACRAIETVCTLIAPPRCAFLCFSGFFSVSHAGCALTVCQKPECIFICIRAFLLQKAALFGPPANIVRLFSSAA